MNNTKYLNILFLILVFLLSCSPKNSNKISDKSFEKEQETLKKLIKYSWSDNILKASQYIVYRGQDQSRRWKSICTIENEDEMLYVQRVINKIKRAIPHKTKYSITKTDSDTESEGTWYVLHVDCDGKKENRPVQFAFLRIDGKSALGDIDF